MKVMIVLFEIYLREPNLTCEIRDFCVDKEPNLTCEIRDFCVDKEPI